MFLGAALFSDVLLIRVCLSLAFVLLVLQCVISTSNGLFLADATAWAFLIGLFHWRASYTLIKEELAAGAQFQQPNDEALFCFLHRHTGIARTDMARLRAIGTWAEHRSGHLICETSDARSHLFVLVEGIVEIQWRNEARAGGEESKTILRSGDCFDLRVLNLCGVFIGFPNERFAASAQTPTSLFVLPLKDLSELLQEHEHFLGYLRTLALSQLARQAQFTFSTVPRHGHISRDSFGQLEDESWIRGARSRDFEPLSESEMESMRFSWKSTWHWVVQSLKPSVQPGCRHESNPLSGSLAQTSVRGGSREGLVELLANRGKHPAPPVTEDFDPLVVEFEPNPLQHDGSQEVQVGVPRS